MWAMANANGDTYSRRAFSSNSSSIFCARAFLPAAAYTIARSAFSCKSSGFQLDPAFVRGHGFLEHALLPVGEAEAPVSEVEVRVDLRNLLAFRDRLIVPAGVVVRPAQIGPDVGSERIELLGALAVRDRLFVAAHGAQVDDAIPIMGDRGIRVQLEGAAIAFVGANPVVIVVGCGHRQRGIGLGGRGIDLERPVRRLLHLRKGFVRRQIAKFSQDIVRERHGGVRLGKAGSRAIACSKYSMLFSRPSFDHVL